MFFNIPSKAAWAVFFHQSDQNSAVSKYPLTFLTALNYPLYASSSARLITRRSLMKKKVVMVAMLFVQVFLTSENVLAAEIQSLENGKGNLCPANNDSD